MFSDLTKASYTNYLCSSALDLHEPAINAFTYLFFFYLLHPISLSKRLSATSIYNIYIYACKVYNTGFR